MRPGVHRWRSAHPLRRVCEAATRRAAWHACACLAVRHAHGGPSERARSEQEPEPARVHAAHVRACVMLCSVRCPSDATQRPSHGAHLASHRSLISDLGSESVTARGRVPADGMRVFGTFRRPGEVVDRTPGRTPFWSCSSALDSLRDSAHMLVQGPIPRMYVQDAAPPPPPGHGPCCFASKIFWFLQTT